MECQALTLQICRKVVCACLARASDRYAHVEAGRHHHHPSLNVHSCSLLCFNSLGPSPATWHCCVFQALVCELRVVTWRCCVVLAVLGHGVLVVGGAWLLCVVVGAGHW